MTIVLFTEEKNYVWFAKEVVEKNGGIIEHPKTSKFWLSGNFNNGFMYDIKQSDFGHRAYKNTRLYICGTIAKNLPRTPLNLGYSEKSVEYMGRAEREHTPIDLAIWLINTIEVIKNDLDN